MLPPAPTDCITSVRDAKRALAAMAVDPGISPARARELLRTPVAGLRRLLASNPGCPAELMPALGLLYPKQLLGNPAFTMLCEFDPGFLPSVPLTVVEHLANSSAATRHFRSLCALRQRRCRLWQRAHTGANADDPTAPSIRDRLRIVSPSPSVPVRVESPARPQGRRDRPPPITDPTNDLSLSPAWSHRQPLQYEDIDLVRALAGHGLFSGACRTTMRAIAYWGAAVSLAVFHSHPAIAKGCGQIIAPGEHPMIHGSLSRHKAPSCHKRWDAIETVILASARAARCPLPRFLLLSGARCPSPLLADAVRRDDWPMRLAVALNPALHPSIRKELASSDPNPHVRAAAHRKPRRSSARGAPIPASLVLERYLAPERRRALSRVRRALRPTSSPARAVAALEQALEDPVLRRLLLNGVYVHLEHRAPHYLSAIHRFAPGFQARWIAREVALSCRFGHDAKEST
jgi:hypothetical protein